MRDYALRHILRLRPINTVSDYSSTHLDKGADYAREFEVLPCRANLWELEQRTLRRLLLALRPGRILDFATGTGRIAQLAAETLPGAAVAGIDISTSMLAVARANSPSVNFVEADGRQAAEIFGAESFDLATAFRFFPNAEPELRRTAARQIASLVRDGGHVIVNNHRNFWSISYVAQRLRPNGHANGMLNSELEQLFHSVGFQTVERVSLGLWPQSERKPYLLPMALFKKFESWNCAAFASRHALGYDTIFVFRKSAPSGS